MGFISWAVLGLIVGVLARVIMPGKDKIGLIMTVILGIAGAVVGGYIASRLGWGEVSGINLRSLAIATCGAIALLWIYKKVIK